MTRYINFIILALILLACSEKSDKPASTDEQISKSNESHYTIDSAIAMPSSGDFAPIETSGNALETPDKADQTSSRTNDSIVNIGKDILAKREMLFTTIKPDKLIKSFPTKVNGFEPIAPNFGNRDLGGNIVTYADVTFTNKSHGVLKFVITDFGGYKLLTPDDKAIAQMKAPIFSGRQSTALKIKGMPAYKVWNDTKSLQELVVLVDERLLVKIELRLPEEKAYQIENTVDLIDFKLIKQLLKSTKIINSK